MDIVIYTIMDLDKIRLKSISRSNMINIVLIVIILILALYYAYRQDLFKKVSLPQVKDTVQNISAAKPTPARKLYVVNIEGAVAKPGVYEIEEGKRIVDIITMAEGFRVDADVAWIDVNLNKAQKLSDGMKLYIPPKSATTTVGQAVIPTPELSTSININTSTQAQLESLPGIGVVTATAIIKARPYSDINELTTKKVISKSVFDKIKAQLSV